MKETYAHKVTTSFYLWFDHTLLSKGEAFTNYTSELYYTPDHRVEGALTPYSSPFKQWVCDSSIPNASIPTIVSGDGVEYGRSEGAIFDFDNGRVMMPAGTSGAFSGSYAVKDFNVYTVDDNEKTFVLEGNFQINSRYGITPESGVNPYDYALPAAFISSITLDSKPFALGGEQDSKMKFRAIVMTNDKYNLDGCLSVFKDMAESHIALVSASDAPFNEYGDLKSGVYNYETLIANPERMLYLEKVAVTKVATDVEQRKNPNLKFGIIDFYLSEPRFPKQDI